MTSFNLQENLHLIGCWPCILNETHLDYFCSRDRSWIWALLIALLGNMDWLMKAVNIYWVLTTFQALSYAISKLCPSEKEFGMSPDVRQHVDLNPGPEQREAIKLLYIKRALLSVGLSKWKLVVFHNYVWILGLSFLTRNQSKKGLNAQS